MKKLNKLAKGKDAREKREIAHAELAKVKSHKFTRATNIKGRSVHDVGVEIVSVGNEGDLFKVVARCWLDGVEMLVDNPLYYRNAPILVPDGTFETVIDPDIGPRQVANFHEDAPEALRQIVLETIKVTALKV